MTGNNPEVDGVSADEVFDPDWFGTAPVAVSRFGMGVEEDAVLLSFRATSKGEGQRMIHLAFPKDHLPALIEDLKAAWGDL